MNKSFDYNNIFSRDEKYYTDLKEKKINDYKSMYPKTIYNYENYDALIEEYVNKEINYEITNEIFDFLKLSPELPEFSKKINQSKKSNPPRKLNPPRKSSPPIFKDSIFTKKIKEIKDDEYEEKRKECENYFNIIKKRINDSSYDFLKEDENYEDLSYLINWFNYRINDNRDEIYDTLKQIIFVATMDEKYDKLKFEDIVGKSIFFNLF